MILKKFKTNNGFGDGISTFLINEVDKKQYIVSTARDQRNFWQAAIFKILDQEAPDITSYVDFSKKNLYKNVYPGPISKTFSDAEKIHEEVEKIAENVSEDKWLIEMINLPRAN